MYLHFFFNDTATTEIYTLSLHDALPIFSMACSPCSLQRSITDMMLERRNPASLRNREPIIRARGVEVGFGERTILRGLDLDVYRGEILGFVGGSGQGKSVLTRAILGLVPKDRKSVV